MAIVVANTYTNNTFDYWRNRTNELAYAMSTYVVTAGTSTSGNVNIIGTFTANSIIANNITIGGGTGSINTTSIIANSVTSTYGNVSILSSNTANVVNLYVSNTANVVNLNVSNNFIVGNLVLSSPTTIQQSNGQYYLNANGQWSLITVNTVGGSNTQIQFNDSGVANGSISLTFDKTSNTLSVPNISINNVSTNNISLNTATIGNSIQQSIYLTTNGISTVSLDNFSSIVYRGGEYIITATDNANNFQVSKLLFVQDGTNSYITEYGSVFSNNSLMSFSSSVNVFTQTVSLYVTPSVLNTTIKGFKTLINV